MLGGLDPVIIFHRRKRLEVTELTNAQFMALSTEELEGQYVDLPPIPVYLSETLFNIAIVGAGKSVDFETDTMTLSDGENPDVKQRGIQSGVEVTIEGKRDSIALIVLSSLIDVAYEKATSKEYAITFLSGATTVFRGVLHSFSAEEVEGTDKLSVKISLSKGDKTPTKKETVPSVPGVQGAIPIGTGT